MTNNAWSPPASGHIKLNVDGSSNLRTKQSTIGVIARDEHGTVRGSFSCSILFCFPLLTEVWAVWHGFR